MSEHVPSVIEHDGNGIPNYSVKHKAVTRNGKTEEWAEVKFGTNPSDPSLPEHVVDVRRVDMGDQFDLAEIAGSQVENSVWLSLAIVAMSVQTIDGVPEQRSLDKKSLRNTLVAIGPTGVRAVREAINSFADGAKPDQTAEGVKAAAGN